MRNPGARILRAIASIEVRLRDHDLLGPGPPAIGAFSERGSVVRPEEYALDGPHAASDGMGDDEDADPTVQRVEHLLKVGCADLDLDPPIGRREPRAPADRIANRFELRRDASRVVGEPDRGMTEELEVLGSKY